MNTTTTTTSPTATSFAIGAPGLATRLFGQRSLYDWFFAMLVLSGATYAFASYGRVLDVYETGILIGAVPLLIGLGWFWGPLRHLAIAVAAASLAAIALYSRKHGAYGADLAAGEQVFWLKYFLSSQSAILWMSVLFYMSTLFYWIG
ncbi:MAG TPA: c-type cytochrome biogenesis protein CcsB, partial [Methylibium sp.]